VFIFAADSAKQDREVAFQESIPTGIKIA